MATTDAGKGVGANDQSPQGGHRAPGNACLHGCRQLAKGVPWREAGGKTAGGCGSVMRACPFGLVFADSIEDAELLAVEHSKLTHGDPIALAACAAMAVGMVGVMNCAPVDRVAESMTTGPCVLLVSCAVIEAAARYDDVTAKMLAEARDEALNGVEPDVTLDRLRGWAAHEAIAAGLYVLLRHADSPRDAILEGANTPGDSDSIAPSPASVDSEVVARSKPGPKSVSLLTTSNTLRNHRL